MVADVAMFLNGRGHRNVGAAAAGLATADDRDVVEYCLTNDLIVVTFDLDFGMRCCGRGAAAFASVLRNSPRVNASRFSTARSFGFSWTAAVSPRSRNAAMPSKVA